MQQTSGQQMRYGLEHHSYPGVRSNNTTSKFFYLVTIELPTKKKRCEAPIQEKGNIVVRAAALETEDGSGGPSAMIINNNIYEVNAAETVVFANAETAVDLSGSVLVTGRSNF